jgi:hypothetical protein
LQFDQLSQSVTIENNLKQVKGLKPRRIIQAKPIVAILHGQKND